VAQVLEAQFPPLVETQPELVAQHYTAVGCAEPAVLYWQRAGEQTSDRSPYLEAISLVTTGIEQLMLLSLAQRAADPALAVVGHYALGVTWLWLGALPAAHQHLEAGIARYTPDQRRALVFRLGQDTGVVCRVDAALTLWLLGYPAQALGRLHEALALAHGLSHPYSLAWTRCIAAYVLQFCRDVPAVHEQAEAAVALSTEQSFAQWAALGTSLRGWTLVMQGQGEEGIAQPRQGTTAWQATGAAMVAPSLVTRVARTSVSKVLLQKLNRESGEEIHSFQSKLETQHCR
jgi:hypothetical protein